jgi:hypothetical protein
LAILRVNTRLSCLLVLSDAKPRPDHIDQLDSPLKASFKTGEFRKIKLPHRFHETECLQRLLSLVGCNGGRTDPHLASNRQKPFDARVSPRAVALAGSQGSESKSYVCRLGRLENNGYFENLVDENRTIDVSGENTLDWFEPE